MGNLTGVLTAALVLIGAAQAAGQQLSPKPESMTARPGQFTITPRTVIWTDAGGARVGHQLARPEGYRLDVRPTGVVARAAEPVGLFDAVQSIRQVLPSEIFRETAVHIGGDEADKAKWKTSERIQAFRRLSAPAEVVWSPRIDRNYKGFLVRLDAHAARLRAMAVNYRPLDAR